MIRRIVLYTSTLASKMALLIVLVLLPTLNATSASEMVPSIIAESANTQPRPQPRPRLLISFVCKNSA